MSWYQLEVTGKKRYRLCIKWWHPGFWMEAFQTLRESGMSLAGALYFSASLVLQVLRRKK